MEALRCELNAARACGSWSPGVAAFEALERKFAELETAAPRQGPSNAPSSHPTQQNVLQLLTQQQERFEDMLAAKNLELDGFRQQVEALLAATQQLRCA